LERSGTHGGISKLLRNEEKRTVLFQKIFGSKRNKHWYSKAFQKQRETIGFVPKKFGSKRNKQRYSRVLKEK